MASLIGKLRCFDSSTVDHRSLRYARALIEITLVKPLPSKLKVRLAEEHDVEIDVQISWNPEIYSSGQSFGHIAVSCPSGLVTVSQPLQFKIPLLHPVLKWVLMSKALSPSSVPKASILAIADPVVIESDVTDSTVCDVPPPVVNEPDVVHPPLVIDSIAALVVADVAAGLVTYVIVE